MADNGYSYNQKTGDEKADPETEKIYSQMISDGLVSTEDKKKNK